jgi:hypothetical protein
VTVAGAVAVTVGVIVDVGELEAIRVEVGNCAPIAVATGVSDGTAVTSTTTV